MDQSDCFVLLGWGLLFQPWRFLILWDDSLVSLWWFLCTTPTYLHTNIAVILGLILGWVFGDSFENSALYFALSVSGILCDSECSLKLFLYFASVAQALSLRFGSTWIPHLKVAFFDTFASLNNVTYPATLISWKIAIFPKMPLIRMNVAPNWPPLSAFYPDERRVF